MQILLALKSCLFDHAIDLIAQTVLDFKGSCTILPDTSAILNLPVKLVDGRIILYRLLLKQKGERITAQEETPEHLPAFCPERHINLDGTFCLYYADAISLKVVDKASARAWLETLYKYLKLQERVHVQRRWPNNDVWAHGRAAYHQYRAQVAAAAINEQMASALADGQLRLKHRNSRSRPILELWIEDTHIYSVWELDNRVINQKQRCLCGKFGLKRPKRLRGCADHATRVCELAIALRDWKKQEDLYWKAMQGKECCSTCDSCPLKHPKIIVQHQEQKAA